MRLDQPTVRSLTLWKVAGPMEKRLLSAWICASLLAVGAYGQDVSILTAGQYYHRASHLSLADVRSIPLKNAVAEGYDPCPECTPPILTGGKVRDEGSSAYYRKYVLYRQSGEIWSGKVSGRTGDSGPKTGLSSLEKLLEAQSQDLTGRRQLIESTRQVNEQNNQNIQAIGKNLDKLNTLFAPGPRVPQSSETAVPGTGGLLKALTFETNPQTK